LLNAQTDVLETREQIVGSDAAASGYLVQGIGRREMGGTGLSVIGSG
jgi:hypothetical protein